MHKIDIEQPSSASRLLFPYASVPLRCYTLLSEQGHPRNSHKRMSVMDSITESDGKLCLFIKRMMITDQRAVQAKSLGGIGEDLLLSLRRCHSQRALTSSAIHYVSFHSSAVMKSLFVHVHLSICRWVCDITAAHFIKEEIGGLGAWEKLPEVCKNTRTFGTLQNKVTYF